MLEQVLAAIAVCTAIVVGVLLLVCKKQLSEVRAESEERQQNLTDAERRASKAEGQLVRFQSLVDVEAEVAAVRARITEEDRTAQSNLAAYHAQMAQVQTQAEQRLGQLQQHETQLQAQLVRMRDELSHLDEQALFEAHGLYESRYDFGSAEEYKNRLEVNREGQKSMTKEGLAAICRTTWTVEGSEAKGRKMIKDMLKLMLRAFNGECDAAVARVKYNNIESMEKRIERAFKAINKLGSVNQCEITASYLQHKIEELRLTHEYTEKRQAEKEEQRLIRAQMREEEKAAKELAAAEKTAASEEQKLAKAIAKAQKQAEKAAGERHEQLMAQIKELEGKLTEANSQRQRAVARAQLTRSGHVYVISNVGSFGNNVYKIGMTRRLEPLDRVKELGDASVPFKFDVHAMIYAEDAPALEKKLHEHFRERQVNLVNNRKEFFHVALEEIEGVVRNLHGDISFVRTAAAEEFRKSVALRTRRSNAGAVDLQAYSQPLAT